MATISDAHRRKWLRSGPRYQMEVNFPDDDSKKLFLGRLERVKAKLSYPSSRYLDNFQLLSAMLDFYESSSVVEVEGQDDDASTAAPQPTKASILKNSGKLHAIPEAELEQ